MTIEASWKGIFI